MRVCGPASPDSPFEDYLIIHRVVEEDVVLILHVVHSGRDITCGGPDTEARVPARQTRLGVSLRLNDVGERLAQLVKPGVAEDKHQPRYKPQLPHRAEIGRLMLQ